MSTTKTKPTTANHQRIALDDVIRSSYTTWVTRDAGAVALETPRDVRRQLGDENDNNDNLTTVHTVFLVHGWMGNPREMNALRGSLVRQWLESQQDEFTSSTGLLVHGASANENQTTDGVAAGGQRLAREIRAWLEEVVDHDGTMSCPKVTLSVIGNSLGGLYARYALRDLAQVVVWDKVTPTVFATTATPHLGVGYGQSYLPLPRFVEHGVATALRRTGADLFRTSRVLDRITLDPAFTDPLRRFARRWAYANGHGTDFQVPTATAAFVDPHDAETRHRQVVTPQTMPSATSDMIRLVVETEPNNTAETQTHDDLPVATSIQLAAALDHMGWTKVFCDVRPHLTAVPVPSFRRQAQAVDNNNNHTTTQWLSSADLYQRFARWDGQRWYLPVGHTVLVANAKNDKYAEWNRAGRPVMDYLAANLLDALGEQ